MYFAVLDNRNRVQNVIVAETKEIAEELTSSVCVEVTETMVCEILATWDGEKFIPFDPTAPENIIDPNGPSKQD